MLTTIFNAFEETLLMLLIPSFFAVAIGLPLGFLLHSTNTKQICNHKAFYYMLKLPLNFLNSLPYLFITVFCFCYLKATITEATTIYIAILPLTITAISFFSTLVYQEIASLPKELNETATAFGATTWQTLIKIYLPEIFPNLILGFGNTLVQLISYSTIAGLFGAGGLGGLIMQKGYYSFELKYLIICTMLLASVIFIINASSQILTKQLKKH